jgi:hypothetical protein
MSAVAGHATKLLLIINMSLHPRHVDSQQVITSLPIGRGVDFAGFDPIFREKSANDYEDAGPVKTQPSARTMAFDPKTQKIFLSAAEIVESAATTPGGRPQRSVKPGSFVVIVVGKS